MDIIANENEFTNQNEIKRLDERIKRIQEMNYNEDVIIFMAKELNIDILNIKIEANINVTIKAKFI